MAKIFDFSNKQNYDFYSKDFGATTPKVSTPTVVKQPTVTPSVAPARKLFQGSALQKVGDFLSLPSYATGGFIKGSGEEFNKQALSGKNPMTSPINKIKQFVSGVKAVPAAVRDMRTPSKAYSELLPESKLAQNKGVQLATDLVLDPLNVIPIGKMIGGASKLAKKVPIIAKTAGKIDDVAKVVKELPIVQNLAKKFVKGYGIENDVVNAFDTIPEKVGKAVEPIIEKQKQLFGVGTANQLSPEETRMVAMFLEPKGAGKGVNLAELKTKLGSKFDEVIRPILREEKKINQELVLDAASRGNLRSTAAKELYNRPYFSHQFEKKTPSFIDKVRAMFDKNYKIPENTGGAYQGFGKKVGVKGSFWEKRKGATGFSLNTPEVIARRQIGQVKDNFIQDAIKQIGSKYGVKIRRDQFGKILPDSLPDGYRVPTGTSDRLKDLYNTAIPNNIADYLDETLKGSSGFEKAIDRFNAVWKPLATTVNPAFHLTNMIGNMYNSFLGGVANPKRYYQMIAGQFSKAEDDLVKSSGILQRGEFLTDTAKQAFGTTKQKALQTPNHIGSLVENNARKALFLDALEKISNKRILENKNAVKYFRGGGDIDLSKGKNMGISITSSKKVADFFSKTKDGGKIYEVFLKPNAKILKYDEIPKDLIDNFTKLDPNKSLIENLQGGVEQMFDAEKKLVEYGRKNNFDAIDMSKLTKGDDVLDEAEIRVINPSALTKSSDSINNLYSQKDIEDAVKTVDKFLFNYQTAMTPFEQNVMRRFFPFYSWFRQNVPLQLKSLTEQSAKPAAVIKGLRTFNEGQIPEDLSVPTKQKDKDGKEIRYRLPLPVQDVTTLTKPETARDMLNPVLKMFPALANWMFTSGGQVPVDYWSGRELTNKDLPIGEQAKDIAKEFSTSLVRPVRTVQKIQKDPTSASNWLRSLVGGFYSPQGEESKIIDEMYKSGDMKKALQDEITKSIKVGDTARAKRLEKILNKQVSN